MSHLFKLNVYYNEVRGIFIEQWYITLLVDLLLKKSYTL